MRSNVESGEYDAGYQRDPPFPLYLRYLSCQGCVGLGALMIFADAMGEDVVMTRTTSTWHYGVYQFNIQQNASARDNLFPVAFLLPDCA